MWGQILSIGASLLMQRRSERSADSAEERERKRGRRARRSAERMRADAEGRLRSDGKAALAEYDKRTGRAVKTFDQQTRAGVRKFDESHVEARRNAKRERAVQLEDYKLGLVRLREAANKAGFNPLTVLGSGYAAGATSFSSGFLSGDTTLGFASNRLGTVSNNASSRMSGLLGSAGQGLSSALQSAEAAINVGLNAYNSRMNAYGITSGASQGAKSAETQKQAVGLDYLKAGIDTAFGLSSEARERARIQLEEQSIGLDRDRLALDREVFASDRAFREQQRTDAMAMASAWGRLPGAGVTVGGGVSSSVISGIPENAVPRNADGSVANRDLLNGTTGNVWDVAETHHSPAQYWEDEYGEVGGAIMGTWNMAYDFGVNSRPVVFGAWNDIRTDWGRPIRDYQSDIGAVTQAIRNAWSGDGAGYEGITTGNAM